MVKYELDINDENLKITIEKDILGRNSNLITLSKLLVNLDENITISIDGKWGSGKTFFVKQFKYLIEHINEYTNDRIINSNDKEVLKQLKETNLIVYYNAWENDSHSDPLESLMYNILNEYPAQKDTLVDFNEFKKLLKSFCIDFIKVKTNNIIDLNNIDKMNSFTDLAKDIVTIDEKKKAFNELINNILSDKKRIILIIDELDRCKPTFAVEILETIKHFYTNRKITIIVSTNNSELSNTIKKFYGNDFDGYGYLNKFYDYIINLEVKDIKPYLQKQFNICNSKYIYHDISYLIMSYYNFSLRECNRYMTLYNMLKAYIEREYTFNKNTNYIFTCVLLPLALGLKIKNGNQYHLFMNKKGTKIIEEFLESIISGTHYEEWISELIGVKEDEDYKKKIVDNYLSIFSTEYSYGRFPFFDAISLLGTDLLFEKK